MAGAVVRAERLFRQRRRQRDRGRRRRALRPVVVVATAGTVLAGGVWAAWSSPLFALDSITVKGTSRLTVAEVLAAAHAPMGRSLLHIDPGPLRARVAALPAVSRVVVDRDWPHRLVITVDERQPAAVVDQPGGAELVDGSGVAFARTSTPPSGLLSLTLSRAVPGAGDAEARAAMQVWAAVPADLRPLVVGVMAASPVDVSLRLTGRRTVVWGAPGESAQKAAVLQALMARRAAVYDVSTPDVPVTR